jgi:hypothetical protein
VSKVCGRFTGDKKQPADEVEAQVQERMPHLSLVDRSDYEGKGLPASWHCALHDCRFRATASSLVRPGGVGCPDCREDKKRAKRRARFADPDLERHLTIIAENLGEKNAEMYRLRCSGATLEEIGALFGVSDQAIHFRLRWIKSMLANKS